MVIFPRTPSLPGAVSCRASIISAMICQLFCVVHREKHTFFFSLSCFLLDPGQGPSMVLRHSGLSHSIFSSSSLSFCHSTLACLVCCSIIKSSCFLFLSLYVETSFLMVIAKFTSSQPYFFHTLNIFSKSISKIFINKTRNQREKISTFPIMI